MRRVKPIALFTVLFILVILIIPSILVLPYSADTPEKTVIKQQSKAKETDWDQLLAEASPMDVSVYRTKKDVVETLPLEQYIVGVVAAEMPSNFELEALKAQSLAARTYIVKQLMAQSDTQVGILKGANVSDTTTHQVFQSNEELREKWGADYKKNITKIQKAVYETRGEILVFDNMPITASYFSTSNGYTENAEDYWNSALPYLVSVESPWDAESPKFSSQVRVPKKEFEEKLGVKVTSSSIGEIVEKTKSNRVKTVKIGNKQFSGREIRDKLGLRSTDFTWKLEGNEVVIQTKGFGHGIGMSQYGANGMAKEGKTFEEIIRYYYQGVEISSASKYLEQYIAKK